MSTNHLQLEIHSDEKSYPCSYCTKSFKQSIYLKRHLLIHSGENPYPCVYCMKAFNQLGNLTRHLRIHLGEEHYTCNYCKSSFRNGSLLKQHLKTHSEENEYLCVGMTNPMQIMLVIYLPKCISLLYWQWEKQTDFNCNKCSK